MTHPFSRADVPRGAERELADVSRELAHRGHRVHVVTGSRSGIRRHRNGRLTATSIPLLLPASARDRGWTDETGFAVVALAAAAASRANLLHCLHYSDAWGALRVRRLRRRPVVLKLTGAVLPDALDRVRINRRMFREAVAEVDEVWCNSDYARREMAVFGREMTVVPAPVDLTTFRRTAERDSRPLVVCTSSPMDERKRVVDLIDAWPQVRAQVPDARLVVAGAVTSAVRQRLLDRLHDDDRRHVELRGTLSDSAIVDLLSRSHVAVAPAVFEALGLATLEALACGTPVAGAASGATADLLREAALGRTFQPGDPESCADAVLRLLDGVDDDDARRLRRAAAEPYDLPAVVSQIESRYTRLRSAS